MSGVTEILLIIAIVLVILFLPRLAGKRDEIKGRNNSSGFRLSGKLRIAVFASVLWPSAIALLLRPWDESIIPFLYVGIAPVVVFWGIRWIVQGYRKNEK